jgi:hypothetical protein
MRPQLDIKFPVEGGEAPSYHTKDFYPANIGEQLSECYRIVSKLGYGRHSTVWLGKCTRR